MSSKNATEHKARKPDDTAFEGFLRALPTPLFNRPSRGNDVRKSFQRQKALCLLLASAVSFHEPETHLIVYYFYLSLGSQTI